MIQKEKLEGCSIMDKDTLNGIVKLSDGNIDLKDLNPMDICETEGEFLARQALLSGDEPNQYYISGCGIYRYKDIPEDELKWYHVADIYEIKAYLGHEFLRRFKVGKYRGEYICKIINEDLKYITWCLDNMRGFALTFFERKCYEYNLRLKDFNDN